MKFLFWLAVGLLVWWAWRRSRSSHTPPPAQDKPAQEMVSCAHCGIHLPHSEAVSGTRGDYCSTAHRSAAGDHNPD